jgi:branched-chain amino acid transport system permease protein
VTSVDWRATAQTTFDIVSLTSILVILVLGLGVIVGLMGVFNFAHGEMVLLGALVPYLVVKWGGSVWIGMLLAPFALALVGLVVERLIIRRLYDQPLTVLLVTWGLALSIREIVRTILGTSARSVPHPLEGRVTIGGVILPEWRMVIVGCSVALVVGTYLALTRTTIGLKVRATLDDPDLARASGISPDRIYSFTFAFGAGLAGLAGALLVPLTSLYAELGVNYLIRSFFAVMVGGTGSFGGSVAGATFVGGTSGTLPLVMSNVLADVLVFVIAVVVLRVRPQGIWKRS